MVVVAMAMAVALSPSSPLHSFANPKSFPLTPSLAPRLSSSCFRTRPCLPVLMKLRAVETFDSTFQLQPECQETLQSLLNSLTFRNQVAQQARGESGEGISYEFTGELFQPVPWSVNSKRGMPQEFEKYLHNQDYVIINVPPNFMFKAKIFKPSRLCAVFKRVGDSPGVEPSASDV